MEKKLKNIFCIILIQLLALGSVYAQAPVSVRGTVSSSDGTGLPDISVIVKDTQNGTVTDENGNYLLNNVPAGGSLVFSAVGFKSQEIPLSGRQQIDLVME